MRDDAEPQEPPGPHTPQLGRTLPRQSGDHPFGASIVKYRVPHGGI